MSFLVTGSFDQLYWMIEGQIKVKFDETQAVARIEIKKLRQFVDN